MRKKQIMIVEDDGIVADDIKDILESTGYEVAAITSSGEEALKEAKIKKPDLVLMDIKLQGKMDGIMAADLIRSHYDIPVVYLTSFTDDKIIERAKITEPFGYIVKPFDDRVLHTNIELALFNHKIEKKLKEREAWLSTTLKSIGDAVITVDTKGCVTFMNSVAETLSEWKHEDACGKPLEIVFDLINDKTGKRKENPEKNVFQSGVITLINNISLFKKNSGAKVPIDGNAAPIKDNKGNIIGAVLAFRDISEQKRIEQRLVQSEKLKALGVMTSGIAHEFNNILSIIQCNAQFLEDNCKGKADIIEGLGIIHKAASDGAEIVRRMQESTVVEKDQSHTKLVDIRELIKQVIDFTKPRWKEMAQANGFTYYLNQEGLKKIPDIPGNPSELREVLLNIINNALEAMPMGGSVSFKTWEKDGFIFVSISDNGRGMSEEVKKRIFDPFFTTRSPEGNGLGMSIAYNIITKYGGKIDVDSQIGKGSKITIKLPVAKAKKMRTTHLSSGSKNEIKARNLRILIVDDDREIGKILSKSLSKNVQIVKSVDNGIEAIKLLRNENYDLMLCDLVMPKVTGIDVIKTLDILDKKPKVGLITGWRDKISEKRIKELKLDFIIRKPFDFSELAAQINDVIHTC